MSIQWENAVARRGVYQKLEVRGKDIRPVSMHTFTFLLSEGGPALPDRHPYYTATGHTEEEAEQKAYIVYMRAVKCQHRFVNNGLQQMQCKLCDVRLDGLQAALLNAQHEPEQPQAAHTGAAKPATNNAATKKAANKKTNAEKASTGPLAGLRKLFVRQ